eukprot:Hpha_TRINITY_DN14489_c1_g1::TRINITY_DN14489_c1_g1_i1::g.157926::m.157926
MSAMNRRVTGNTRRLSPGTQVVISGCETMQQLNNKQGMVKSLVADGYYQVVVDGRTYEIHPERVQATMPGVPPPKPVVPGPAASKIQPQSTSLQIAASPIHPHQNLQPPQLQPPPPVSTRPAPVMAVHSQLPAATPIPVAGPGGAVGDDEVRYCVSPLRCDAQTACDLYNLGVLGWFRDDGSDTWYSTANHTVIMHSRRGMWIISAEDLTTGEKHDLLKADQAVQSPAMVMRWAYARGPHWVLAEYLNVVRVVGPNAEQLVQDYDYISELDVSEARRRQEEGRIRRLPPMLPRRKGEVVLLGVTGSLVQDCDGGLYMPGAKVAFAGNAAVVESVDEEGKVILVSVAGRKLWYPGCAVVPFPPGMTALYKAAIQNRNGCSCARVGGEMFPPAATKSRPPPQQPPAAKPLAGWEMPPQPQPTPPQPPQAGAVSQPPPRGPPEPPPPAPPPPSHSSIASVAAFNGALLPPLEPSAQPRAPASGALFGAPQQIGAPPGNEEPMMGKGIPPRGKGEEGPPRKAPAATSSPGYGDSKSVLSVDKQLFGFDSLIAGKITDEESKKIDQMPRHLSEVLTEDDGSRCLHKAWEFRGYSLGFSKIACTSCKKAARILPTEANHCSAFARGQGECTEFKCSYLHVFPADQFFVEELGELRMDATDHLAYNLHDFIVEYGGDALDPPEAWKRAKVDRVSAAMARLLPRPYHQ